jgi:adenosine deaminase CECR1
MPLAEGADFGARFEAITRSATPRELYAFLWDLPKGGDIHNHSAFSIPAESWLEMATNPAIAASEFYTRIHFEHCPGDAAPLIRFRTIHAATWRKLDACGQREYVPLRSLSAAQRADWISSIRLDRRGEARNEFFEAIVPRVGELPRDPRLMAELLIANLKRYGAEGLRYLETQYNPNAMAPDGSIIPPDEVARMLRQRLEEPDARDSGVTARFQVTVLRFSPDAERTIEASYDFLDRNRDLWVGLNLAGREDNDKGHALRFLDTFRTLRRRYSGIHLSIHAGEKDSPGREVRNTLLLGAERIGHGANLIHDPDTMLLMRNGRNLVEVSLVSNRLLEYTPDLSRHPFIEYLRFGIPVCLNTDDAGAWDSNLTDEYFLAIRNFRLTWEEVVRLGRNSLEFSFAQTDVKARMLREYDAATAAFERKYASGDWKAALAGVRPAVSGYAARELGVTNPSAGAIR